MNALAAIAAAYQVGVSVSESTQALGQFKNVKRRLEVVGQVQNMTVYDDFAHHPTAIQTTIAGLRSKIGGARLIAVLEPRSNTMQLGIMKQQLSDSLQDAQQVFVYGAKTGKATLGWDLKEALKPLGEKVYAFDNLDQMVRQIVSYVKPSDHILIMSNGGFGGVHQKILQELAKT
jgi:UDP-N-acetylmuramate: L-alanyl-gamma-D-glutamyl-meso-diaminopimelate ligase